VKEVKILLSMILVVILLFVSLSIAAGYKYVGSAKSNKYHYPSCEWALKIHPDNLVTFKSAKEALDAGYIPCKVCRPRTRD
jgi:methylphosphotriester-DNA--protein-cysteine methyltransferase